MKQILRKTLLPAVAISLALVLPAAAAVEPSTLATVQSAAPNSLSFQIPMHDFCSVANNFDFTFQLSNAADTPANITLYFYHQDGSAFNEEGTAFDGMESTLTPGTPVTVPAQATELYHMNFGNHKQCNERIYSGKIVVNSGQTTLLAKGWVNRRIGAEIKRSESITINENKSFVLAK